MIPHCLSHLLRVVLSIVASLIMHHVCTVTPRTHQVYVRDSISCSNRIPIDSLDALPVPVVLVLYQDWVDTCRAVVSAASVADLVMVC